MKKPKNTKKFILSNLFKRHRFTSAIILVGGSSTRFGGTTPKQFLMLEGKPVAAHAILAFEQCKMVDEIVIVCRKGDEAFYRKLGKEFGITKLTAVVEGGDTRQASAMNGLIATSQKAKYILIHDGARPLVSEEIIEKVRLATHTHRAAIAATISKDTVKIASPNGMIEKTEDRNFVYLAATPQGFYKSLYEACAYAAKKEGFIATDDASLLEHYYYPVKLVECGSENIKITTPGDLVVAEAFLQKRKTP
jgi:2-C-methyl-D-erythritol 4-phosphate cytidylyltransferase